jgi:hypothetical protein
MDLLRHRNPVQKIVDDFQPGLLTVPDARILHDTGHTAFFDVKFRRGGHRVQQIFSVDPGGQKLVISCNSMIKCFLGGNHGRIAF